MTPADDLAAFIESLDVARAHPAYATAFQIRAVLEQLSQGAPGEQPHVLFHGLCVLSRIAFPNQDLTDAEIVANPATPELMRYFLSSLRRYRARVNAEVKTTTAQRCKKLADALQIAGGREDKLGKWGQAMQERYALAFSQAREAAHANGFSDRDAYEAGVLAAYAIYRADDEKEQDESDRRKALSKLRAHLKANGYGTKPRVQRKL